MPLNRYCYRHFVHQMVLGTRAVRDRTGSAVANGRHQSVARKRNSNGDEARWLMGMRRERGGGWYRNAIKFTRRSGELADLWRLASTRRPRRRWRRLVNCTKLTCRKGRGRGRSVCERHCDCHRLSFACKSCLVSEGGRT